MEVKIVNCNNFFLLLTRQKVLAGSSYRISTDDDEPFSFFSFLHLFYCISFLSASSFASFFLHPFFNPSKEVGKPGRTQMDPDHSLLLPYRISDVEVFDYQLAALRTEFIRLSSKMVLGN